MLLNKPETPLKCPPDVRALLLMSTNSVTRKNSATGRVTSGKLIE